MLLILRIGTVRAVTCALMTTCRLARQLASPVRPIPPAGGTRRCLTGELSRGRANGAAGWS
jgi:hypothetical protein